MKKTTGILCFLLISSCATLAQQINKVIDSLVMASIDESEFNGTVLVAKGGKIILLKGYGYRNAEKKQANDAGTIYNIASLTKPFTASLVLQLQDAGKLSVQDKLNKYYPEFPNSQTITIHHLLTHTSGIPDYVRDPAFQKSDQTKAVTLDAMMAWFNNKPLDFEPGAKFQYSNSGYTMLGAIIEKITGMSYAKALEQYIFKPLGMHHTSYGPPAGDKTATGYSMYYKNFKRPANPVHPSVSYATGAIYSSVEDLYKWHRALQKTTIYINSKGRYSYGWFTDSLYGRQRVSHDGNIPGYKANINRFSQDDICIIALSNSNNSAVGGIVRNIVNVLYQQPFSKTLADQPVITLADSVKQTYTGVFRFGEADSARVQVLLQNNELFVKIPGNDALHIQPVNKNVFKSGKTRVEFMRNNQGGIRNILVFSKGEFLGAQKTE